jgi:hypothetical protein
MSKLQKEYASRASFKRKLFNELGICIPQEIGFARSLCNAGRLKSGVLRYQDQVVFERIPGYFSALDRFRAKSADYAARVLPPRKPAQQRKLLPQGAQRNTGETPNH